MEGLTLFAFLLALAVTVSAFAHIAALAVMYHNNRHDGLFAVVAVSAMLTLGEFIYVWKYMV